MVHVGLKDYKQKIKEGSNQNRYPIELRFEIGQKIFHSLKVGN